MGHFDQIVAVLCDHGLSSNTARSVAELGEELRRRTEREGIEC